MIVFNIFCNLSPVNARTISCQTVVLVKEVRILSKNPLRNRVVILLEKHSLLKFSPLNFYENQPIEMSIYEFSNQLFHF